MALQFNQYVPVGYINTDTPQAATVSCGANLQVSTVATNGVDAVFVPFNQPLSWAGAQWTSDSNAIQWICQVPGIYSMNVAQTLILQNTAEIVNPIVNMIMSITDNVNAELNQTYTTTLMVPITTGPIEVGAGVANIVNANVGTFMSFALEAPSGNITVSSGGNNATYQGFTYNLIAQGNYGNVVPI